MLLNLQGYPINIPDPPKDKKLIWGWDKPRSEQFWQRPYTLSDEQYEQLSPSEQAEIRRTETERRVSGFWFYNNGKEVWITGDNYFFLTHFKIDGEYPLFLMNQVEDYYFDFFCENDPYCYGSLRMKPRREGCTQRRLATFLNQGMMSFHSHYGIQSKTAEDAEKVNFDSLVKSFFELPKWMQPELQNTSLPPHQELVFGKKRGGQDNADRIVLNTKIDWKGTVENAYDGKKLAKVLLDEVFKFEIADFEKTWDIVKYCLQNRGRVVGKAYCLSTVGEMSEDTVEMSRRLWRGSNYDNRPNKQTVTGLYRWFIPDYCAYFGLVLDKDGNEDFENGVPVLDKYGYLNVDQIKKFLKKKLDSCKSQQEKINFIRKNPPTAEEALNYGSSGSVFDTLRLSERAGELEHFEPTEARPIQYRIGNLYWKDNVRFGQVVFRDKDDGKFRIAFMPDVAGNAFSNRVYRGEKGLKPFADTPFRMGIDPYSYDNREGEDFSKGAFHVKLMSNIIFPHLSNIYCLEYLERERLAEMFYEDIALAMFFFGARINFERSPASGGLEKYLQKNKLVAFAMQRPDVTKRTKYTEKDSWLGTPATPEIIEMGIRYIENYIAPPDWQNNDNEVDNLKNFYFDRSVKQLMDYTVKGKTKFDLVASMIQTEIACQPDKKIKIAAADHHDVRQDVLKYVFRNPQFQQPQTRKLVTV